MTAWRYEFFLLVYKNIFQNLKGNYLFCAAMLNLLFTRMRPRPQVSATFSFRIQKFPRPHRIRMQIEFVRPHVSDTYPDSL